MKVVHEYDEHGRQTYYRNSDGHESWCEYDEKGRDRKSVV